MIKTIFNCHENYNNVNDIFSIFQLYEKDGKLLLNEVTTSGNFEHIVKTKADLMNKWKSFLYMNGKTFRFRSFNHWACYWSPLHITNSKILQIRKLYR